MRFSLWAQALDGFFIYLVFSAPFSLPHVLFFFECVCVCVCVWVCTSVRMLTSRWRFLWVCLLLRLCLSAFPLSLCGCLKVQLRTLVKSTQNERPKVAQSSKKALVAMTEWLNEWMNEWAADWASECQSEWMTKCATRWLMLGSLKEFAKGPNSRSSSSWNAYFFVLNSSSHFLSRLIFILPRDSYFASILLCHTLEECDDTQRNSGKLCKIWQ